MNNSKDNIERLERLNMDSKNMIQTWLQQKGRRDLQRTRLHTFPRFETILKIIKDQNKRILELESKLKKYEIDNKKRLYNSYLKSSNFKINPLNNKNSNKKLELLVGFKYFIDHVSTNQL